jgi:hypothetical protein
VNEKEINSNFYLHAEILRQRKAMRAAEELKEELGID